MKCYLGVDTGTGYFFMIEVIVANIHDVAVASELIYLDI